MSNNNSTTKNRQYFEYLEQQDNGTFFAAGACHIFALELHRRYGYPLYLVEKERGQVTHVYCIRRGRPFDVRTDIVNPRYFFECYPGEPRKVTEDELLSLFTGNNWNRKYGLWGEPSFVTRAIERAKQMIEIPAYAP
jgi:hypothetical protein